MDNHLSSATPRSSRFRLPWYILWVLSVIICLATLTPLFYALENWRGKRAWENCKKELQAKGEQLELDAFIPPSVPDKENMLKVPLLARWMDKNAGVSAIRIPETGSLQGDWASGKPTELAEWIEFFYVNEGEAPLLPLGDSGSKEQTNSPAGEDVMPLIAFDDVPLKDALRTLARQAGINLLFDPEVEKSQWMSSSGPSVSVRWENISTRQGCYALLDNYGLMAVQNPNGPTNNANQLVIRRKPSVPWTPDRSVRMAITASNSLQRVGSPTNEIMPLIIIEDAPLRDTIKTLARQAGINFQFDPALSAGNSEFLNKTLNVRRENVTVLEALVDVLEEYQLSAVLVGSKIYRITRPMKTAAEIVAAFEDFDSEFEELYAACAKPKARFDCDYKGLFRSGPLINFVNLRVLAQSLTLRASAELALSNNEEALRDITTCIRLADCLSNEPTLVSGMIRVAINGLIIGPIWEGLAARRWDEKQLSALQKTLSKINLVADTVQCFRGERAYENFMTLGHSSRKLSEVMESYSREQKSFSRGLKCFAVAYAPRGWVYQNVALGNRLYQQSAIDVVDLKGSVISPEKVEAGRKWVEREFETVKPSNFIASVSYLNLSRALRTVAQNQTGINEAVIACALERYRLAQGEFSKTLDALAPGFLARIPHDLINGQPLKYRRTEDGQYILYSVAWDNKDDDGRPAPQGSQGNEAGDWVWRFPAKRTAAVSAGSAAAR